MNINGVNDIPSGLVSCLIDGREVRIQELGKDAFRIRSAREYGKITKIQLNFYLFKESRYEEILLDSYTVTKEEETPFAVSYVIQTTDALYEKYMSYSIKDYWEYISLKQVDDGYCAKEKAGYPEEKDADCFKDFSKMKKEWFKGLNTYSIPFDCEMALVIEEPLQYESFLQQSIVSYAKEYYAQNGLTHDGITRHPVERVYLGNQFCHNLRPTNDQLFAMLEKAANEQLGITIVYPYLREDLIEETTKQLERIYGWCKEHQFQVEIVVNDWGMEKLLQGKYDCFTPILGILLNKRKKDPRFAYKVGFDRHHPLFETNNLNDPDYQKLLKDKYHMERYEYESCSYSYEIAEGKHSLHLPFYQTNTSQYCTLYAKCKEGDRGRQQYVTNCPKYCQSYVFAYPKHLKMVGRYNSLFGYDETILKKESLFKNYRKQGIDRIVLNLL